MLQGCRKNLCRQSVFLSDLSDPQLDSVGLPLNEKIFLVQSQVIKEVAEEGPCVIVGRSANYVLSENPNCINIFLQADLPTAWSVPSIPITTTLRAQNPW